LQFIYNNTLNAGELPSKFNEICVNMCYEMLLHFPGTAAKFLCVY